MTMPTNTPGPNPWGPPPGMPGMPPPFPQEPRNGLGVAALVIGIVGLLVALVPFLFWLGAVLGVLALVFGIIGIGKAGKGEATNKGSAVTGVVTGALAVVVSIVWVAVLATAVKDVADEIEKETEKLESATTAPAAPGSDSSDSPEQTAPAALAFGQSHTYPDGVKVTVSTPRAYKPDQFAAGHGKGNSAFQVTVTIVNGSKKALDVSTALPDASDAEGAPADAIFDGSDATEMFQGTVLPGKQAKSDFAFSLPAGADHEMQLEMAPKMLEYDDVIWTGKTK
ncbi:DUF4190 domain-containing protein [Streptomyces sp. NPDC003035]|uniref:DUF4190 domain-containing protein n=1 Tax=Streptomyces sp. NPDC003035 TaxID=3364676 RepID=UPI00369D9DC2